MWYEGFLGLSAWSLVAVTLLMTHVTIVAVTVYLHRYSAHRSLELNAGLKHFFPLLAVADHGTEHPRVDGHPPQTPRQMRNRR